MEVPPSGRRTGGRTGTCVPGSLPQLVHLPPGASRQHPVPRENLAAVPRGHHAHGVAARALPPPWPCTQHRACRARVTCGTAHAAGHGQCCAALHEHRHAPLDHDRHQFLLSAARARPPAASRSPPRMRAHTRTHTRTRTRARRPGLCVPVAKRRRPACTPLYGKPVYFNTLKNDVSC